MRRPVLELSSLFEKDQGIKCRVISAPGGVLLSQIEFTKKGDIYIAGSPHYLTIAEKKSLIITSSVKKISFFVPSIIVKKHNRIKRLEDLSNSGIRIALSSPRTCACGRYTYELLRNSGFLDDIRKNIKVVADSPTKMVNYLLMNKVDAIIGWRVMAYWYPKELRAIQIDPKMIKRISYSAAGIITYSRMKNEAAKFIEMLVSKKYESVYIKNGYIVNSKDLLIFSKDCIIGGKVSVGSYFE